jgi:4-amino-4-deoxy-L-arabinose transferase-like glycosyltransferase
MLLLLTAAGLLVRVVFLLIEPETAPVADETVWTTWGASVLTSPEVFFSPLRFRLIFHPPLYPYFIGASYALFGSLKAVRALQAGLGALLVPAVGRVGRRAFGGKAGLLAAALAAFYPELVWFSVHFWAETLFLVLLWWGLEELLRADAESSTPRAAVAGLLFGLAILTRETLLYFVPVAALFLAARRPRAWARGGALLGAALLTVAPWTLRNWIVYDAFVPVSTAGALNLFQGNALLSRQEVYEEYWAVHGRIEKYRFAREKGLQAIWARQPTWIFEKLKEEMPNFWEADSQPLIHVKRGAYGDVRPLVAASLAVFVLLPYLLVLAFFVAGLSLLPLHRGPLLLVGFLLYYNLLHVATHGYARYRLPVLPVLFLVAGSAFVAWRAREIPALSRRRKAVGVVAAVVLALALVPSFRGWMADRTLGAPEHESPEEPGPP